MKKIALSLLMVLFSVTFICAQGLSTKTKGVPSYSKAVTEKTTIVNNDGRADDYSIDFEAEVEWTFDFTPWTVVDVDQLTTYGFTNYTFPHNYEAMAYIVFNPATTEPSMSGDPEIQPHSGAQFGACMASVPVGGQGNDDWFMSPKVLVGNGASFTFWAKSYTDQYGLERFNVAVSTTGNNPADFTIISGSNYLEAPIVWTEYIFDLSAYTGQEIYVAIECVSNDAFVFMIDDLVIDPGNIDVPCDNFDSYTAGQLLCPQSTYWVSWDNNPAYDGYVTDQVYMSSPNALAIEEAVLESDLLHDLGQKTTERWEVSLDIFVPTGTYGGYIGVMQDMEIFGTSNEWGFQAYFRSDASGVMADAALNETEFSYIVNEWNHVSVIVNFPDSSAEFWVNYVLVHSWKWDVDGPNMLGAFEIWAGADGSDLPKFYVDNVCYEKLWPVGVDAQYGKSEILLFPNPADQMISITSPENIRTIRIFSTTGQMVYQNTMDKPTIQIDVKPFKSGLYTVQIATANGTEIKKFMKR